MKKVLALRHVAFENLGAFAPTLQSAGYDIQYCETGIEDLAILAPEDADLVIILGGPIGAYEDNTYPFLTTEISYIERRLALGLPTMGICLGAQLIARAAGARVFPARSKEIGLSPITLTGAGVTSCLAPFCEAPMTLHWHGDNFDLPKGAEHLASTPLCENQAFAMGSNTIAFQFHPEANMETFENWLIGHAVELSTTDIDIPRLRAEARTYGPELSEKAGKVLTAWLEGLED